MPNEEHVSLLLTEGIKASNAQHAKNFGIRSNLSEANLCSARQVLNTDRRNSCPQHSA
jgi:hypothetical protein